MEKGKGKTRVKLIRASAGTGKTYSLTGELCDRLRKKELEPERVIAVTFTRAAAGELQERVRSRLFREGLAEEAHRVEAALIGTVHSVCERILKRFAFEAGISPEIRVLPEDEAAACFRASLSGVLAGEELSSLTEATHRLGIDDWQEQVRKLAEKARANGIPSGDLKAMAGRATEAYFRLFPPAVEVDPETADRKIVLALEEAVRKIKENLAAGTDTTKKTSGYLRDLKIILARSDSLTWMDWANLEKKKPGKASWAAAEPVIEAAGTHLFDPRLREDIGRLIRTVYALAAAALESYDRWKRERGYIDFTDMEAATLFKLLENPSVADSLSREFDLLLVDEFQDTSPLQLALFSRLGEIAGTIVWVGDRKQSIYKFRDCDPELMEMAYLAMEKDAEEVDLPDCYRSRQPLVEFCSAVFAKPFVDLNYSPREFALGAPRGEPEGLPPPLEVWNLDSPNKDTDTVLIAEGIRQLLNPEGGVTVVDKASEELRPARPGDIAVLRNTNAACEKTAAALNRIGIRTSSAQAGLTETPEGVYVLSALEVVLDPEAGLPALLVRSLSGAGPAEENIGDRIALAQSGRDDDEPPWPGDPILDRLRALAGVMAVRSPAEMLDLVIEESRAREICLRQPRPEPALANIEKLRAYADLYEEICRFRQTGATPLGLLLYFRDLADLDRDEKDGRQAAGEFDDAVTVSTYHRAKGREWPVVILGDLDRKERAKCQCLDVHVLPGDERFDPDRPLKGRWIRYWPWPYGGMSTGAPLHQHLADSEEEDYARGRDRAEAQRLLYVGFTRARDILVLPSRKGKTEPPRLADLGTGLILPLEGENGEAVRDFGEGRKIRSRLRRLIESAEPPAAAGKANRWFVRPEGEPPEREPLNISPSARKPEEAAAAEPLPKEAIEDLGEKIAIRPPPDPKDTPIGNAVHDFFAADREDLPEEKRLEIAARCRAAHEGVNNFTDRDLITAADRLHSYIRKQWPDAKLWRELPLECRKGEQEIRGVADLVIETGEEIHLIDHKTQPLEKASCPTEAPRYFPQLEAYAEALEKALGKPCRTAAIHFPFAGVLVYHPKGVTHISPARIAGI